MDATQEVQQNAGPKTVERDIRVLAHMAEEWTSDFAVLDELCEELCEVFEADRDNDELKEICIELLAKENLPKPKTAELNYYLAELASDDNDLINLQIRYFEAEYALVDVEADLKADNYHKTRIASLRPLLDTMRDDLKSRTSDDFGEYDTRQTDEFAKLQRYAEASEWSHEMRKLTAEASRAAREAATAAPNVLKARPRGCYPRPGWLDEQIRAREAEEMKSGSELASDSEDEFVPEDESDHEADLKPVAAPGEPASHGLL